MFASLYVPTSGNRADLTAVEKDWYRNLLVFLRGTKSAKNELKEKKPDQYHHFEEICSLRERHVVKTYRVNMSLHFELVMKWSAIIPFAREEDPQMS